MESWVCIVVCKSLFKQGPVAVRDEVKRLAGKSYVDFRLVDDGFDGERYAFVKCDLSNMSLEPFRKSPRISSVLSSYDNPTYLCDDEVYGFVVEEEERVVAVPSYGDMVEVVGDGPYSKLRGVVTLPSVGVSQVLFRLHTMSRRAWIENEDLDGYGSVFASVKFPTTQEFCFDLQKYPVTEDNSYGSSWKSDR